MHVRILSLFTFLAFSSTVFAFDRHPVRAPVQLPDGVPTGYVHTHNGFFHPSCVYTLGADESFTAQDTIVGRDGAVHDRVTPCAYSRFGLGGLALPFAGAHAEKITPHTDNGYLLVYVGGADTGTSVPTGTKLSSTWKVPDLPLAVGVQDIAFFNAEELDSTKSDALIFQPVLDFGEVPGTWIIESESCCFQGNDLQSDPVAVSPGDVIQGTVVPSGCDGTTGICTSFVITSIDTTTGKSTMLAADPHGLVADSVFPAALETRDISECGGLPASGEVVFDTETTDTNGNPVQFVYNGLNCIATTCPSGGDVSSIPKTCGWNIDHTNDAFTLTFGATPHEVDGGEDLAGAVDASLPAAIEDAGVILTADASAATGGRTTSSGKHGCSFAGDTQDSSGALVGAAIVLVALYLGRRRLSA